MTRKQLEAARDRAENRVAEWYDKYLDELACLYVRRKNGRYVRLFDEFGKYAAFDTDKPISRRVADVDIYEEDDDAPRRRYLNCTSRAVKRLRRIETKINEWETRAYELDLAADECRE